MVEVRALRDEQHRVGATERDEGEADRRRPAHREPERQEEDARNRQAERERLQPDVLRSRIHRETDRSQERSPTRDYARTTRAWRLNARTSSTTASIGIPSRHSTIGTPSDAYFVR